MAVRGHIGIKRCLHDAKACLAQGIPEKSCVKLESLTWHIGMTEGLS